MSLDISSAAIQQKNKLTSKDTWLLLIKLEWEGEDPGYLCLNGAPITWLGQTWSPGIFSLSGMNETKDSEVPSVSLNFYDLLDEVIPIIDSLDGAAGAIITAYVVHSTLLANPDPELEEQMEVIETSFDDSRRVTVKLGAENLADLRCPLHRYLKNQCRFTFKDSACLYSGSEISCNRTLARCRELENSARFGGLQG